MRGKFIFYSVDKINLIVVLVGEDKNKRFRRVDESQNWWPLAPVQKRVVDSTCVIRIV